MAIINPHTTEKELYSATGGSSLLGPIGRENGLRVLMLGASSVKEKLSGVLLPSYDYTLDTVDTAFGASVGPCWKNVPDPEHPKHWQPNGWATPLFFYTFVGASNAHFISPVNRRKMLGKDTMVDGDDDDAFNDLYWYIKKNKQFSDTQRDYYLKKPARDKDARVPNRQTKFAAFASTTTKDDRDPKVNVILYTPGCQGNMIDQMRWINEDQSLAIDKRFPRYLLGDPTRVESAMVWDVDKRKLDPSDPQETNCILWTDQREVLRDPLVTRPITRDELLKRFVLIDDTNWNFPTYQEMVDFMVAEFTEVPIDLIDAACGHRANVGTRKEARQHAAPANTAPAHDDTVAAVTSMFERVAPPTNPAAAPAAAPSTVAPIPPMPPELAAAPAPAPAPVVATMYVVAVPGSQPQQITFAELLARANESGLQVVVGNAWVPVASSGLIPPAMPPVPPAMPPVPTMPAIPAAAAPVATTTAPPDATAVRRSVCSDSRYEAMSPHCKAAVDEVTTQVAQARAAGLGLSSDLSDRLLSIADQSFGS